MLGKVDYPILNLFWTMLIFFIFVAWITVFIRVFFDNFRRNDHSGFAKAAWTVFLIAVPFLGVLVYLIARPKMTPQDQELMEASEQRARQMSGYSAADEIVKLQGLRDAGTITQEEFDRLKKSALA